MIGSPEQVSDAIDNELIIDDDAVIGPGAMIHGCAASAAAVASRDCPRRQRGRGRVGGPRRCLRQAARPFRGPGCPGTASRGRGWLYILSRPAAVSAGTGWCLVHTEVPVELEGRGIGGRLVIAAVDRAARQGLTLVPLCPFARGWLERHPEAASKAVIDWDS